MLDAGKEPYLVDVREPVEFEIVKIPGGVLIPKDRILSGEALAELPQDRAAGALLPDRRPLGRGARRGQGGRLPRRGAPPWRGDRLGDPGRPVPAHLLSRPPEPAAPAAGPGGAPADRDPSRRLQRSRAVVSPSAPPPAAPAPPPWSRRPCRTAASPAGRPFRPPAPRRSGCSCWSSRRCRCC